MSVLYLREEAESTHKQLGIWNFNYQVVTSQLYVVEEIGEPGENPRLTQSHWQLFHMPFLGFEPVQW